MRLASGGEHENGSVDESARAAAHSHSFVFTTVGEAAAATLVELTLLLACLYSDCCARAYDFVRARPIRRRCRRRRCRRRRCRHRRRRRSSAQLDRRRFLHTRGAVGGSDL